MGDMGDAFNDLKAYKREQRAKRADGNLARMHKLGIPAFEQSKNVYRVQQERRVVMYYPSSNCWQHNGKIHRGSVENFASWLKTNNFEVNHAPQP